MHIGVSSLTIYRKESLRIFKSILLIKKVSVNDVSSDILSRNDKSVTMQNQF
jgi:hypothetical protein